MISRSYIKNLKRLVLLSMIASAFTLLVGRGNLSTHTHQYLDFANCIKSGQLTPSAGVRPCGYPLLVFLTGYTNHGSMIGIYIIQALCGFGFPILFYSFIGKKMPTVAFVSSLILIFSMYPYQLVKLLTYDQISNFLVLLCACSLLNGVNSPKFTNLLSIGGITAILANFKAANILIPVIPIGIISLFIQDSRKNKIIKVLILAAISIALTASLFLLTKRYSIKERSYTGCQLFYGPYINSKKFGVDLTLNQGVAMQDISRKLEQALHDSGKEKVDQFIKDANINSEVGEDHFNQFKTKDLSIVLLQNPKYLYFEFICHLLKFDNDTFLKAAEEVYSKYPALVIKYFLYNLKVYFTDPGWRNFPNSTRDNGYRKLPYLHELVIGGGGKNYRPDVISDLAAKEVNIKPWESLGISKYISAKTFEGIFIFLSKKIIDTCPIPLLILNVIAISIAFLKKDKNNIIILIITTSFIAYNASATCLTAEPEWFYKMNTLPMELAGATVGVYYLSVLFLAFIKRGNKNIISINREEVLSEKNESERVKVTRLCFVAGIVVAGIASLQTILALWKTG